MKIREDELQGLKIIEENNKIYQQNPNHRVEIVTTIGNYKEK